MSERHLPDWLDAYMEYTENSEPPDLFRKWVGISVLASALRRKCYLQWGMLTFYPNLYVILVGPAATRKGTAMYPGQELLRKLEVPMAADATTLQALIRRLRDATDTSYPEGSKTPMFHSSMTVFSKEFTVFLGYKNDELIASLCDWYDCDSKWKYDTKNAGTDEIIGVWVNLIGATTPDLIRSSMPLDAIGGGLSSRIIFVYEAKKGKTVVFPFLSDHQRAIMEKLFYDLERIAMLSGKFRVEDAFMKEWDKWYTYNDQHPPGHLANGVFASYCQRRPNHLMKLSMILSISRSSEMIIRVKDLNRAKDILELTENKMPQVFSGVGQSDIAYVIEKVIMFIRAQGTVPYETLMRSFYADADVETMERILRTLTSMRYIQETINEKGRFITFIGGAMTQFGSKESK